MVDKPELTQHVISKLESGLFTCSICGWAWKRDPGPYGCRLHQIEEILVREWSCAMIAYAKFIGEWSNYFGDFKRHPLYGGNHTAVGDCLATLALIRQMAESRPVIESEAGPKERES